MWWWQLGWVLMGWYRKGVLAGLMVLAVQEAWGSIREATRVGVAMTVVSRCSRLESAVVRY